jgi:3-dehydroquinate synthase
MSVVRVTHALGSYPVYVQPGAIERLDDVVRRYLPDRRVVMIADETVLRLFRQGALGTTSWTGETLGFPPGERSKTRDTWAQLTDALLNYGLGRDGGVVTLGGGVAGDLGGFVAATYLRGLPYVQVPTTLLAMVDASIGGKTGVDTPQGKNLIGAFHPPVAVLSDPRTLATLPDREYRGGLAEAVKHGLIADREYFKWMEREADALLRRDSAALEHLVRRSVEIKAEVVGEDERESGRRAILNAGHTVAHALERVSDYALAHGEAVALGLVAECRLATRLGLAAPAVGERVETLLARFGLPVRLSDPAPGEALIAAMASDKKNRASRIRFALPGALGEMTKGERWTVGADETDIRAVLESLV